MMPKNLEFQTLKMAISDIVPLETEENNNESYTKTNFDDLIEGFIETLEAEEGENGECYALAAPVVFLSTTNDVIAIVSYVKVPAPSNIEKPEIKIV